MSLKNNAESKKSRKAAREANSDSGLERRMVSDLPYEAAVQLLTSGEKLTRRVREGIMSSRGVVINRERKKQVNIAVKNLHKLREIPMVRLLRERVKAARRAATLMYKAQKSTLGSTVRGVFESAQQGQLAYLKQVQAELDWRAA